MIFRIIARNKERSEAYAELLDRIELLADGRVFCLSQDGTFYFSDWNDIMYNASIKRRINHYMYKISLDGYGISYRIPEVKIAERGEKK